MSISLTAQSKCYSSKTKAQIAKRLKERNYLAEANKNLHAEIFQLEIQNTSKELKINTLKQAVIKLNSKLDNKDKQISILVVSNQNQKELTKIAKRKKIPAFLKGVGVGAGFVILAKILLIR